jgi:hypothetical protein
MHDITQHTRFAARSHIQIHTIIYIHTRTRHNKYTQTQGCSGPYIHDIFGREITKYTAYIYTALATLYKHDHRNKHVRTRRLSFTRARSAQTRVGSSPLMAARLASFSAYAASEVPTSAPGCPLLGVVARSPAKNMITEQRLIADYKICICMYQAPCACIQITLIYAVQYDPRCPYGGRKTLLAWERKKSSTLYYIQNLCWASIIYLIQ